MEDTMSTPTVAVTAAQIAHLTPEQQAWFTKQTAKAQSEFLAMFPAPPTQTGPLWFEATLDGKKFLGIPAWMMATKLMGAARSADTMDASSAAIKEDRLELGNLNGRLECRFVHGPDDTPVVIDGVELDTSSAHDARAKRDAEYRAANPRQTGNGQAPVFTPVVPMP